MSSHTLHAEALLTPKHSLLTDEIGNEVYASHYAERRLSRLVIATESLLLLAAMALIFSLAHRPITNRYIRIDEMGRAQAIAYSDLNYSPRDGEVRTYLTDWANYRYTISRDTIAKKYPLNYYFLSQNLASQLMAQDNQNHLVSQVVGGQIEQSDVEVKDVTITSMSEETVQGATIAPWNGSGQYRQALLAAELAGTEDRALDVECYLLPRPQTGERRGEDLPPVRDDQPPWVDHHGVPREPDVGRSDCVRRTQRRATL